MATYEQVTYNSPDGALVGADATKKVGFWGTTPVVQRSGAVQAALTLTTVIISAGVGFQTTAGMSACLALIEEMRAAMVQYGLLKGGA